jgi:hypothetical protein
VTGGVVAVAALQRNATAPIVNASRVIASVHITLSLPCGGQKKHNPIESFQVTRIQVELLA